MAKRAKIKNIRRAAPGAKQPKAQALPGHELVRDARLDDLCEEIGDARERLAEAKKDEQDGIDAAMERMKERKCHRYEFAKVQLTFKPGRDHLAVKVLKESTKPGGDIPTDAQEPAPGRHADAG